MAFAPSRPVYPVEALRRIEARHADAPLMERAGQGAVLRALTFLAPDGPPPLIVCGPGNNGGDGFVVARLLREQGFAPVVVFLGDETKLPADARAAFTRYRMAGGGWHEAIPPGPYALAVDALFGIGLQRPLAGAAAALVDAINALDCPVLALDVPSGLCADSGRVLGRAVRADATLTFIALKPGLLTLDGPDHCGTLGVCDLDLDAQADLPAPGRTLTPQCFRTHLAPRPKNSHKGMMGAAALIGGAPGMTGAALLAGRAALKLGAGRVFVGLLDGNALTVDPLQPELMFRTPRSLLAPDAPGAVAIGPGLGQSESARALLRQAIDLPRALLLDADALNLVAAHPVLAERIRRREAATLITPHPLEAARLLGCDAATVQADRVGSALALAEKFNAVTVLKGCGSIVAAADGRWFINETGNPGMASAGMGDVLSGLVTALLAQGWQALAALQCAVHLHGLAADLLAGGQGPIGLAAGDTPDAARHLFNAWHACIS